MGYSRSSPIDEFTHSNERAQKCSHFPRSMHRRKFQATSLPLRSLFCQALQRVVIVMPNFNRAMPVVVE